jgi:hypothetical protein
MAATNFEHLLSTPVHFQEFPASMATQLRYRDGGVVYILCKTLI